MTFDPTLPVLVIEPDLLSLKLIKRALVRNDVSVIDTTSSMEKALALLKRKTYGLIICEYFLSPMNGFDLMRVLGKDPAVSHIPFILTTSKEPELALTARARELLRIMRLCPGDAQTLRDRIALACELVDRAA